MTEDEQFTVIKVFEHNKQFIINHNFNINYDPTEENIWNTVMNFFYET